jgi:mono/diheme cytochrome c family protein
MSCVSTLKTLFALLLTGLAVGLTTAGAQGPDKGAKPGQPSAEQAAFFDKEVKPILLAHCFSCHGGAAKIKGELRLTSRANILKGGRTGPAVSLEQPGESLLLHAINHESLKMPPKGKLPQAQIEVLTRWVKMGIPWPDGAALVRHGPPQVDDKAKSFWSFRPVARPAVPKVQNAGWVVNPIDAFVLARLEAAALKPAPPADRVALLRRVFYDLIGLPPTPQEVEAFLADRSPRAYEKVVDRLLASPHYGEHWARHWLDLVRYAETNSFERDGAKPFVWRYRDYVIGSFNQDKPYDQFLREQLAGDELDQVTPETLIATGYYRLGLWDDEPADPLLAVYDELDDIASTTGQVFLGLTVGCARCHDHKIDPFPQKDYYRLIAFFHGIRRYGVRSAESVAAASLRPIAVEADAQEQQELNARNKKRLADIDKQLTAIEDMVRPHLEGGEIDDFKFEQNREDLIKKRVPKPVSQETFDRYVALRKQREELKNAKSSAQALCVKEAGPVPPATFLLKRGNPLAKGDKVEPGYPSVLTDVAPVLPKADPKAQSSGRRRVLADWLASPSNPLTARVLVNRVWQFHFGRGLVRSSSNFGYGGTPPTHPELLDWLASEFVARGLRLKELHKLILMSSTYRMSSGYDPAAFGKDPENDLLWRFDERRLTAEEVRDSILAVSGNLNLQKRGGPSVYPIIPKEVLAGQSQPGLGWGKSTPEDAASRSVYVHLKRSLMVPILAAFDAADPDASCPVRFNTTQPTQALGMLNGDFLNEQAQVFADGLRKEAGTDPAAQVRLALWRVMQRQPTASEVERGVKFLTTMQATHKLSADEALRRFCLLALNLNEFMYLD